MHRRILVCALALLAVDGRAQRPNPGPSPRPDPAMEAALKEITPLTTGEREDDHPAVAARGSTAWVVWVSYSETQGTTRILARAFDKGKWTATEAVSEAPGDYYKPAVAIDEDGGVWVAWAAQVSGNWDICGRVRRLGKWSAVERWTEHPGPDILPRLAASAGRVMLVWQALRNDNLDILYRVHDGRGWTPEAFVTENLANDWEPVVAASRAGAFHVAWDSYRGDYDVLLRTLRGDRWGAETVVAGSPRLENRAALSVDAQDRLWIAWEIGPEKWAADSAEGGLRARRDIGIACLDNGRLLRAGEAERALAKIAGERGLQAPHIGVGRDAALRLFFRQPMNRNWLHVGMTMWDGHGWTAPEPVIYSYSESRIDQRIEVAHVGDKLLAVYPAGSTHNVIYAKLYETAGLVTPNLTPPLAPAGTGAPKPARTPERMHVFNGHRLVWGDLHRHTDISEDGGILDGSLVDTMRYALDAAGLEFLGITDHTRYLTRRYNLFRMQQVTDLFYRPGAFVPMHAYERSQYSPWGHRNVIHLNRDYTPVPASYDLGDPGVSPWGLFNALRGKQAISIPHTSAWANKQVSWDYNDAEVEPLVEIYQGLRSTYEYNGAPDPAGRAVYEKDSSNFVWDALARKLRLGFIASSDHRSTHMSYAAVYVKGVDRESILEGLRARRTYAATDKILVDFSIGLHLMGEEIVVSGKPEIKVAVEGTTNLERVDIIKNNSFLYTTKPNGRTARFDFRDEKYAGEEVYYYVRVIQTNRQMAWTSPIWVRRRN